MKNYLIIGALCLLLGCEKKEGYNFQEITPISSVEAFQDIRWKDLTAIESQLDSAMISTLTYNEKTVWPLNYEKYAIEIMEMGKDPGLSIKSIHDMGITGKNVNVGIIDQNICEEYHPEYKNKIIEYYDAGCNKPTNISSMHGPAVLSLLVGETIGVAPDAKIYYAAAPSWTGDAKYFADALNWIIDKNSELSNDEKIRIVSVSAAPSGQGSPFTKNGELWDQAYQRALDSNILVLDCTSQHRKCTVCYYDIFNVNDVTKCRPGPPQLQIEQLDTEKFKDVICAPASCRTQAEVYQNDKYSYQYTGIGGTSWSVPYVAGVLALGWQANPNLSKEQIITFLFETAYIYDEDFRIINPPAFIEKVNNNR